MADLAGALKQEVQRLARKEIRAETSSLKKQSAQQRRLIAELKRKCAALTREVAYLQIQEKRKLNTKNTKQVVPEGTRFSVRSLKAQRRRTGLSQADYGRLIGVTTLTMNNWENGRTRPGEEHLATIVALRGLGKREANKRLELLDANA